MCLSSQTFPKTPPMGCRRLLLLLLYPIKHHVRGVFGKVLVGRHENTHIWDGFGDADMSPLELVNDLRCQGYSLRAEGGKVYCGPAERVTNYVADAVRANKPALLVLLAAEEAQELAQHGLVRCDVCRRILARRHVRLSAGVERCSDRKDCQAAKMIADAYAQEQTPEAIAEREGDSCREA